MSGDSPSSRSAIGSFAGIARTLWILLATVAFVLLIAGTNVANLFLIRAESRQRELAVRAALGAGRGRIAATFLAESLLLAGAGGAAGLVIAAWAIRFLVANSPAQLPRLHEIRMDPLVFAFAAALSLLAALALALVPTATLGTRSFTSLVRDSGRGNTASRARHRLRRVLTVTQLATAMVLLVGSGLMVRSALRMSAIDPGFRPDGVLTAGVNPGAQPDRARGAAFYYAVLDELRRLPGVESAGAGDAPGHSFVTRDRATSCGRPSSFPGKENDMSDYPALDRRRFLELFGTGAMGLAASGLYVPGTFAQALVETPRQTEGPFYPDRLPLDTDNDLVILGDRLTPAVGEVTHLWDAFSTATAHRCAT